LTFDSAVGERREEASRKNKDGKKNGKKKGQKSGEVHIFGVFEFFWFSLSLSFSPPVI
jgi:hypothetical protein